MLLISMRINVEAKRHPRLSSPNVAVKLRDGEDIETVKSDVSILAFANVIGEQTFAMIVRWRLCELARTRDVTASHVEPITLHPPLRNVCHDRTPFVQGDESEDRLGTFPWGAYYIQNEIASYLCVAIDINFVDLNEASCLPHVYKQPSAPEDQRQTGQRTKPVASGNCLLQQDEEGQPHDPIQIHHPAYKEQHH